MRAIPPPVTTVGKISQVGERWGKLVLSQLEPKTLSWRKNGQWVATDRSTSMMIIIAGASLSEQHTDLAICHKICTKQDLSRIRTSRYLHKLLCGYTCITKLYTKVISCLCDILKCRLCMALTWSDLNYRRDRICTACSVGNLPSGVSCHVYFNFSHLNSMLHSKQSSLQASHTELDLRNIKVQMRLFRIFGIWPQTDRQTYIHMHVRNAVTLVWGLLRLDPIM